MEFMQSGETLRNLYKIYRLKRKAWRKADTSYAGEFQFLDQLLNKLKIDSGYIVDIAAGDGCNQSSTLGFFKRGNWSGLAVEMDPLKFSKLSFLFADFPNVRLARNRVTPITVSSLLAGNEVPKDFELLNLDIDSYDLHVVDKLMEAGYRPKIISMEVNEKIPPPIYFTVDYDPEHYWKEDHFFGCSITAAASVVLPKGYILNALEYNNAVFVREDIATANTKCIQPQEAYDNGYRNRTDRKKLFRWNADVDCLLSLSPQDAELFINKIFAEYNGKYTLKII
jgi:hypothetical protein